MQKNMWEIFDEFLKVNTRKEKIDVLRKNDNLALRTILKGAMHPRIEFLITQVPMYKQNDSPAGLAYTSIWNEINRIYLFEKGHPRRAPGFTDERMKLILIQILESLEAKEATVFINMLLKNLRVPGLTSEVVNEAFPGLLS